MIKMNHAPNAGKETTSVSKSELTLNSLALLLCFFALSSVTFAQRDQTFVRIAGDNNNPCTRGEPCRTFAGALQKTNPGGEIIAVDTGEYNPVVIEKPVTITAAPGVTATITATAGTAVTVNHGGGAVVLRGLRVTGRGAQKGIDTATVGTLRVEGCVVSGFSEEGIAANNQLVFIKDTEVKENGGDGINVSFSDRAIISNSHMTGNSGAGVRADFANPNVTIHDSVSAANRGDGLVAKSGEMNVERCVVSNNVENGIVADFSASGNAPIVRVSNSTVVKNRLVGFLNDNSIFQSRGNNTVIGNSPNTQGTIQTITPR